MAERRPSAGSSALNQVDKNYKYGGDSAIGALLLPVRREILQEEQNQLINYDDRGRAIVQTLPAKYGESEVDFSYSPIVRGAKATGSFLNDIFFGDANEQSEAAGRAVSAVRGVVGGLVDYAVDQYQAGMAGGTIYDPETRQITEFDPTAVMVSGAPAGIQAARNTPSNQVIFGTMGSKTANYTPDQRRVMDELERQGMDTENLFLHGTSDDIRQPTSRKTSYRDSGWLGEGFYGATPEGSRISDFYANTAAPRFRNEAGDYSEPNVFPYITRRGNYKQYSLMDKAGMGVVAQMNPNFSKKLTQKNIDEGFIGAEVVDADGNIVERVNYFPDTDTRSALNYDTTDLYSGGGRQGTAIAGGSALRSLDMNLEARMQPKMLIPDAEDGRRRLYNASTVDRDPNGYLEPHTSDWVKEVAEGSGYEGNIEDITSDLVYMSEKPDWVTSIIARDIGKDMADVTLDDVRRYGRLNIIDAEIDADEIFQIGDYSQTRKIKDIAGNERNLWDTSLYDDERFADIPIGPEPEDFISNESQKITYTLTGDDLVDFLNENQPDMMQRLKESASSSGKSALRGLDINAEVANAKAAYDANPNNEELRRSYMALRRERDAMPAEEVTSPLSGSGTNAMMPRDIYDMDEDEYIKAINPKGSRIAPEARPNLGMGDMYGMAPRNAEEVMTQELPSGEIIRYVQDGDSVYALGYNPDLGEEDVIGYMVGGGDGSELAVVDQMQGQGIGGNLSYLYRSQNPMAQSGGFTEAGEAAARQAYRRMMGYE